MKCEFCGTEVDVLDAVELKYTIAGKFGEAGIKKICRNCRRKEFRGRFRYVDVKKRMEQK